MYVDVKGLTVDKCIYTNDQCLQDSLSTSSYVRAVALTPKLVSVGFTADGGTYGMTNPGSYVKGEVIPPIVYRRSSPPSLPPVYGADCT